MFTIKKIEMVNKTFRLPVDLVENMQKVAQQQGISLNNLVIQSCAYALENLGNVDNKGTADDKEQ